MLPVVFENTVDPDLPSCVDIYRQVRQSAYAVLYGVVGGGEKTLHWLFCLLGSQMGYILMKLCEGAGHHSERNCLLLLTIRRLMDFGLSAVLPQGIN